MVNLASCTELKPLIAKKIAKYWIRLHSTDCPPLLADALAIQTLSGNYKDSWMYDSKQLNVGNKWIVHQYIY